MTTQYRSLDRSTHTVIFFASLLVAICLIGSVAAAFNAHAAPQLASSVEAVVVQG